MALNEKTERVIDFSREREWRQRRFERVFEQFNDRLVNFMLHRINVREKVRAKHIFNHFTDTSVEDLQEPFWESHYEYWLLYEYLNIQGKKVVERFFEQYRSELDDAWIKTAARLLVVYPSLYRIKERKGSTLLLQDRLRSDGVHSVKIRNFEWQGERQDLFARIVRIGYADYVIPPVAFISREKIAVVCEEMGKRYGDFLRRIPDGTWRLFMQQEGIRMLGYASL